jgi:hypothetical protein
MEKTILKTAKVAIIEADGEFYVYAGSKLVRVCPSEGMARSVAAAY